MSIEAADLRKLVKIVRQYEVIYGGGISSSDAAVREDCEDLVALLETELGHRKGPAGRKARIAEALPTLMEAKTKPKEAGEARPKTGRSAQLATLTAAKEQAKGDNTKTAPAKGAAAKAAAGPKGKSPAKGTAATSKPVPKAALTKAQKAAEAKALAREAKARASDAKSRASEAKALAAQAAADKAASKAAGKKGGASKKVVPQAAPMARGRAADEAFQDVRSRNVGAAKAAIERADKIAGNADSADESESKKRFPALHLFDAFQQNKLPKYGGFIVCVRFCEDKGYSVIEIIGYENMQDLYPEGDTLVFKSVGCKLYALVEPSGYLLKSVEPVNRPNDQSIPYRFSELVRITTKRFQGILIGRKPVFMPTSFSVFKPSGDDLAVLFYDIADVYSNIQDFLIMILRDRLGTPVQDSRKAAEVIARGIREFNIWMDEA